MAARKRISLIGSTGSVGEQVLRVVERYPAQLEVVALAAGSNASRLAEQCRQFHPQTAAIADERQSEPLSQLLNGQPFEILAGQIGIERAAAKSDADTVVIAAVGFAGVRPTLAAIAAAKNIALANKESLVAAGALVMSAARKAGVGIAPIDSEHSAIWQCLRAGERKEVRRLILTASGGPFRNRSLNTFDSITPAEALAHPTWQMGPRITVDSATMMNKGFEIIEAAWLFDIPPDQIDVVIHPQSIIHSMVEFQDGSVMAQMGIPDMTLPITYALFAPERVPGTVDASRYNPTAHAGLEFDVPDANRFPALDLARAAFRMGSTGGTVLNAADEIAVGAFLEEQLPFTRIIPLVEKIMGEHRVVCDPSIDDIEEVDRWARARAMELTDRVGSSIMTH